MFFRVTRLVYICDLLVFIKTTTLLVCILTTVLVVEQRRSGGNVPFNTLVVSWLPRFKRGKFPYFINRALIKNHKKMMPAISRDNVLVIWSEKSGSSIKDIDMAFFRATVIGLSRPVGGSLYSIAAVALLRFIYEPWHEISNNVVCATDKCSDQPAHTRRLIKAFASRLNIL